MGASALHLLCLVILAPVPALAQTPGPREIRIGLADAVPAARISAAAPFVLRAGELTIETTDALISPETGAGESVLALGSFAGEARARQVAEAFREERPDGPGVRVRRDPETGRYLAVLSTGSGAGAASLRDAGFPEAGTFRIPAPRGEALVVRPFGGSPIRFAAGVSLTADPPASGFLEWEGSPYRGSFTVFRSGEGVTVVNRTNLEEYLFGVVPRELPPDLFPEIEALKAQALAARTYALTPRDAYLRRGYDLCAGPACQVYGGVAAEHPLSTAAIRETAGEAIFHDGQLIDALYTASCGGYTENAENVFSNPTPYLVARACIREGGGVRLEGAPADGPLDAALVRLTGAPISGWNGAGLSGPATREDAASVVSAAVRWLGLRSCDPGGTSGGALSLGAFGRLVEEIRCREPGVPALGPGPDGGELAREGEPALGRLLAEGLLDPSERGLDPARSVSRREVIRVAASLLRRDGALFRRGQIREVAVLDGWVRITLEEDAGGIARDEPPLIRLESRGGAFLFREIRPTRTPGRDDPPPLAVPTGVLRLRVGDFVRYHAAAGPAADEPVPFDLLVLEDLGDAEDRFSRQSSWFVPKNNTDLSAAVNEVKSIGRIVALEPLEFGASGRIVRLEIVGTAGSLELRGLRIRRLLGLAENLFRAEPRRGEDGEVTEWWFSGRGWGHGLGLCQAGAYGMAAAGADYREILAHYYPGTEIRPGP
ncbi:MAG: SpoIID/LytB domain-containing protein [Acidobacteria bacterium]|nr:SpoIID/LytB domain-containing protein [Acidobacteriota bacterium]MYE44060.1 SpoIID/LytB domain-containing protein [Acidobacteriota bacterium]